MDICVWFAIIFLGGLFGFFIYSFFLLPLAYKYGDRYRLIETTYLDHSMWHIEKHTIFGWKKCYYDEDGIYQFDSKKEAQDYLNHWTHKNQSRIVCES